GQIRKLHAEAGDDVTEGQLLVEIDPSTQQAKVDAGRYSIEMLKAQLAEQRAQYTLARQQYQRQQRLAAGGQPLLALVLLAGEGVLGTLLGQLGLEHLDRIAAGIDLGLLGGGVDLDQQLAFRHIVPGLDVQLA
ncbi:hypothetical protein ACV35G_30480, partial [Pseudomonas aeruginosa]